MKTCKSFALSCVLAALPFFCLDGVGARASESDCSDLNTRYLEVQKTANEQKLNSMLLESSSKGCLDLARVLLENGASAEARGSTGQTALHFAAKAGEDKLVDLLLSKGANIEQRDLKGATPLFLAAEAKHEDVVKRLLQHGAQAQAPGRSGTTPLSAAAFNGDTASVKLLLDAKADVNATDVSGKSPIIYAAARGFQAIVELFLNNGINVNAKYEHDLMLLMWASGHTNDVPETDAVALVKMLIDKGARLDESDDRGKTALMIAAQLGHGDTVQELLQRGAKTDIKDKDGKSALDSAPNDEIRKLLQPH